MSKPHKSFDDSKRQNPSAQLDSGRRMPQPGGGADAFRKFHGLDQPDTAGTQSSHTEGLKTAITGFFAALKNHDQSQTSLSNTKKIFDNIDHYTEKIRQLRKIQTELKKIQTELEKIRTSSKSSKSSKLSKLSELSKALIEILKDAKKHFNAIQTLPDQLSLHGIGIGGSFQPLKKTLSQVEKATQPLIDQDRDEPLEKAEQSLADQQKKLQEIELGLSDLKAEIAKIEPEIKRLEIVQSNWQTIGPIHNSIDSTFSVDFIDQLGTVQPLKNSHDLQKLIHNRQQTGQVDDAYQTSQAKLSDDWRTALSEAANVDEDTNRIPQIREDPQILALRAKIANPSKKRAIKGAIFETYKQAQQTFDSHVQIGLHYARKLNQTSSELEGVLSQMADLKKEAEQESILVAHIKGAIFIANKGKEGNSVINDIKIRLNGLQNSINNEHNRVDAYETITACYDSLLKGEEQYNTHIEKLQTASDKHMAAAITNAQRLDNFRRKEAQLRSNIETYAKQIKFASDYIDASISKITNIREEVSLELKKATKDLMSSLLPSPVSGIEQIDQELAASRKKKEELQETLDSKQARCDPIRKQIATESNKIRKLTAKLTPTEERNLQTSFDSAIKELSTLEQAIETADINVSTIKKEIVPPLKEVYSEEQEKLEQATKERKQAEKACLEAIRKVDSSEIEGIILPIKEMLINELPKPEFPNSDLPDSTQSYINALLHVKPIVGSEASESIDLKENKVVEKSLKILNLALNYNSHEDFWSGYRAATCDTIPAWNNHQPDGAADRLETALTKHRQANTVASIFLNLLQRVPNG
jgi:chromosome segregation ATPase